MMTESIPLKVFISYSHDSQTHKDRVLALSDRLRGDGIDCNIDQYEQSPPEGWQRWMLNEVEAADLVLVVCSEPYDRRFRGREEAGKGKGAIWEGCIIIQELYDAQGSNAKFIPIVLTADDSRFIPSPLGSATYYRLIAADDYDLLYRRLTNQHLTPKQKLGKPLKLDKRERHQLFSNILSTDPIRPNDFESPVINNQEKKKVEYYCYISLPKVEQLLSKFEGEGNYSEVGVQAVSSNQGSNNMMLSVISYGRPDVFQLDTNRKRQCALRLHQLLPIIAPSVRVFMWKEESEIHSLYQFSHQFRVIDIDEENLMAKIVAEQDAYSLILYCSLSNFSHTTIHNGKPCFQSTNIGFFKENNPMFFDTLFLITSVVGQKFFGSPIYLKLPIKSGVSL
jgi:SEFIR domain